MPGFSITLPVAGRLKMKFASREAMLRKLGRHISQDGIFLPTADPKSAGTLLAVEISEQSGAILIEAEGEVLWTRKTTDAKQAAGMALRFINMSEETRQLVWQIAHQNREAGIEPEVISFVSLAVDSSDTETLQAPSVRDTVAVGPVIGIDFGTCNSAVAIFQDGKAKLVPSEKGGLIIPSVVALTEKGKWLIGQPAKEQLLINPTQTVFGVKRFLGRNFRSPAVRNISPRFPYQLKANSNDEIEVTLGDRDYGLAEIASMILAYLRECAEGHLQTKVQNAVITVPAYYSENQRNAIKLAASMAGLRVELVFNEPTSAALAYGFNRGYEKRVLVFDLGGGTFDVSILDVSANVFEVKGAAGDPFLGGIDFDQRLVDYIVSQFEKEQKVSVRDQVVVMQRITSAAENAKIQLSFQEQVDIHLPFITQKRNKPIDLTMSISRETLIKITEDLVEKAIGICLKAVHGMGLMPSDIDEILLVGGQSRMPFLQQRIEQTFGRAPSKGVHPDEAVALGAALLGGSLRAIDGPMLLDQLALTIGRNVSGSFKAIFQRGSTLPARQSYRYDELLREHPQKRLEIYQGNEGDLKQSEYLGDVSLELSQVLGEPSDIQIHLELTPEGILHIVARHDHKPQAENLKLKLAAQPGGGAPPPKAAETSLFGRIFGR